MADFVFTVRPLPSSTSLEGAFRVHIPAKDLEVLRLRPGDLCHLATTDGTTGVGITWRSVDQVTKAQVHPVKLPDMLRDAFGFKLGNQLVISKANAEIVHADRVSIVEVSDQGNTDTTKNDNNWKSRCAHILGDVEAIAKGLAFDALSRKGLKKRFLIESIESQANDGNSLFYFDDATELVMQDKAAPPSAPPPAQSLSIPSEGIGGLDKQIEKLNERLKFLSRQMKSLRLPAKVKSNGGILLYGPEGTGKSLLLKRIAQAPWRKVLYIDQSVLPGTTSKSQAAIRTIFADAIAQQPSLIVMDNLDAIAGSHQPDNSSGTLAQTLAAEMDKLESAQVLLAAATNKPNDIDKCLRNHNRLGHELEIPIPDMKARTDILRVMQHDASLLPLAELLGERTHGFVGQDLEALVGTAGEYAVQRYLKGINQHHVNGPVRSDSSMTLVNGLESGASDASTVIETMLEDYERALLDVRPTAMKEVFLETPNVSWSEIGGSEGVKEALSEVIEWPLKFQTRMEALNTPAQKGILFYGPPGCSKTLTAKAVATSSGLNFIAVKGAELTSMYVGESERAVREVFRKARAAAPSIIFFDEIDSIASDRDAGGTSGLNMLTTLLNEMDGIESLKGVLILAATNKPWNIDPALLRPGRFGSLMYISPPSEAARKAILEIRTGKVPLASDVDLDELGRLTEGYSGSEVVEICSEAARCAMRRWVKAGAEEATPSPITRKDFEAALQTVVRGITTEMTESYVQWRHRATKDM